MASAHWGPRQRQAATTLHCLELALRSRGRALAKVVRQRGPGRGELRHERLQRVPRLAVVEREGVGHLHACRGHRSEEVRHEGARLDTRGHEGRQREASGTPETQTALRDSQRGLLVRPPG